MSGEAMVQVQSSKYGGSAGAHAHPDTSGLGINTEFVPSFGGMSGWHTR